MADNVLNPEKKRSFDSYETTVESTVQLTPRNKAIRFRIEPGKSFHFKAGQFVQIFVPQEGDKPRRSSYSIASSPKRHDSFELCVTLVEGGVSSGFIHHLKVGDRVHAMGPLGKFTLPEPLLKDPVFICTGSGVAPFRSMINDLFEKNTSRNVYLIFGNRYDPDIIYQTEWETLAKNHPNFKYTFTLSRPTPAWKGLKGYVQDQIEGAVKVPKDHDFFICGLSNMINAVQDKLLSLGVPKEQIHYERYD